MVPLPHKCFRLTTGRALVLALLVVGVPATPAASAPPRCFGATPTVVGTSGDDELVGTSGPDVIVGLAGTDTIEGKGGNDRICSGPGGSYEHPEGLNGLYWEVVKAGPGHDRVFGGSGPDQVLGGRGNDRIYLGNGGIDSRFGVDNDALGGSGDDVIFGTAGSDHLLSGRGDDRIFGRGEHDYFEGGPGRDRLSGGRGRDEVAYYQADHGIEADLRKGRIDKGVRVDRVHSIGDVIGTEEPDVLRGSRGGNKLVGSSGDDLIYGRGGSDCLGGANGTNELFGGAGVDHYASSWLDCFEDRRSSGDVTYWPTTAINVDLLQGRAWRVGEVSNLTSIEGAYGTFDADNLLGDDNANELYGGPGRDEIDARAGDDFLDGGGDTDTLNGGVGVDACVNGEVITTCE